MGRPVVIVTGPSGAGKNYLIAQAMEQLPAEVHYLRSMTTRLRRTTPPDAAQADTDTMLFVSKAEFLALRDAGRLIEWDLYNKGPNEQYYGTPRSEYEAIGPRQVGIKSATEAFVMQVRESGARVVHVAIQPENYVPRDPQRFRADLERAERGPKPDHVFINDHAAEDRGAKVVGSLVYLLRNLAASSD